MTAEPLQRDGSRPLDPGPMDDFSPSGHVGAATDSPREQGGEGTAVAGERDVPDRRAERLRALLNAGEWVRAGAMEVRLL